MSDLITPQENRELRLRCLIPFVAIASKHSLTKDEVFVFGEKAYDFVMKTPGTKTKKTPVRTSQKPGQTSEANKK